MEFETETYSQRYCKPSHKQRAYELRREQRAQLPFERDALTVTPQAVTLPENAREAVEA